jgi:tryptophan 2,3-dioxygenase
VAEALTDHDEQFSVWRSRHVHMVERIIGAKPGTGGSSGVHYLRSTLDERFFPELWELRTRL